MKNRTKRFPAKILLFGEYTILHGGSALAMPFGYYYTEWKHSDKMLQEPKIQKFLDYITFCQQKNKSKTYAFLDLDRAMNEANMGKYIDCNIPLGYGLGSSGAVCAAIYHEYAHQQTVHIEQLQAKLSMMEHYFHGTSSGIDPLVSYLWKVIVQHDNNIRMYSPSSIYSKCKHDYQWGLIDSRLTRSTQKYVHIYKSKLEYEKDMLKIVDNIRKLNERAIEKILNVQSVEEEMRKISSLQWHFFGEMIPNHLKNVWYEGLISEKFFMKLCGAGGGGMFLVYYKDRKHLSKVFGDTFFKI